MNLDPTGPCGDAEWLAPAEWTLDIEQEDVLFRGVVKRAGAETCRIAVASDGLTDQRARTALADKARIWIKEYLSRTPTTIGAW